MQRRSHYRHTPLCETYCKQYKDARIAARLYPTEINEGYMIVCLRKYLESIKSCRKANGE